MTERRWRNEDTQTVDHTKDRTLDWKSAAPKWLILVWGTLGWTIGGFGAVLAWNQIQSRVEQIEHNATDPWKAAMALHAESIGDIRQRAKSLEERVTRIEAAELSVKMERLSGQLERLSDRLARNGYGGQRED